MFNATDATASGLAFADIELAMRDIPPPPKMRARPEFVQYLLSKLPAAEPSPAAFSATGMDIVEDPHLHCKWLIQYHDKTIFEDLDGKVWTMDRPKLERLADAYGVSRLPAIAADPPIQHYNYSVRWARPAIRIPIYMDGLLDAPRAQIRIRVRRPSRGMRKHIRRTKAEKRRETQ